MIARVLRVEVDPDRLDELIATYQTLVRPIHARAAGLRVHAVLVDRSTGRVEIVGIWDDAEAVAMAAPTLEPARRELWRLFDRDPALEIYEVADELIA
jgi:quinol monooxygenase YgiN